MKIPHAAIPRLRAMTLFVFIAACATFFGYLWVNMGGVIPGVSKSGYRVSFEIKDVDNLVYDSDVMVAGVRVGKVRDLDQTGGTARVVVQLDDDAVMPLHEGATVHVRSKSLIEETYLEFEDGDGAAIPNGGELPVDSVKPAVQLDDLLKSLDAPTRRNLSRTVRSMAQTTHQSGDDLSQVMTGLGALGRDGHDVLGALAAQSEDLEEMVGASSKLLAAVDTQQGRVVSLVENADLLAGATAENHERISSTMRKLPRVLDAAKDGTESLSTLSTSLSPVTRDLAAASPTLNKSLEKLPAVTSDVRGLLPDLDESLDRAPKTLRAVPGVSDTLTSVIPDLRVNLADLNPMLAFLNPYGRDLSAFFANWTAMLSNRDANGHYLRIFPVLNEQSIKGNPLPLNSGPLDKSNAYPAPGESANPGPFSGTYPHVEADPR
ncbi:hypothetical protein ASG90_06935 [Nocardioides sp. Soil797]|nr:hypothetical protein ASG90_06935 [Nocardioides sp. Soil797]